MKEFDYTDENIERTIEQNYFSRNKYLVNLIDIINNTNECNTLAINGVWGSGKTVFMHQFLYLLKNKEKYNTLSSRFAGTQTDVNKIEGFYYNAWENDLIRNPTINLLYCLIEEYSLFNNEEQEKYKDILNSLAELSLRFMTNGMVGVDNFKRQSDNNFSEVIKAKEIKDKFSEMINIIKKVKNVDKILIVIDELDRCKPSYSVELLETLKHFYINNNLIFIISTDLNQLSHTVKKLYGESFDADLYLQRFFDGVFTLNIGSTEQYINEELKYDYSENYILSVVCSTLIEFYGLSIREINKFIKQIKILSPRLDRYINYKRVNGIAECLFVPWGLALKYKNNEFFIRFRQGRLKKEEFDSLFEFNPKLCRILIDNWHTRFPNTDQLDEKQLLFELYKSTFLDNYLVIDEDIKYDFDKQCKEKIKTMIDF